MAKEVEKKIKPQRARNKNLREEKERKAKEAAERKAEYAGLAPHEKLSRAKKAPGEATKSTAKAAAEITATNAVVKPVNFDEWLADKLNNPTFKAHYERAISNLGLTLNDKIEPPAPTSVEKPPKEKKGTKARRQSKKDKKAAKKEE